MNKVYPTALIAGEWNFTGMQRSFFLISKKRPYRHYSKVRIHEKGLQYNHIRSLGTLVRHSKEILSGNESIEDDLEDKAVKHVMT